MIGDDSFQTRVLRFQVFVFLAKSLHNIAHVEALQVFHRLRGQGACEIARRSIDALTDQIGLRAVRFQFAIAAVMINRRDRIVHVILIEQAKLEVRLRGIVKPAVFDHFLKLGQRFLIAALSLQLLRPTIICFIDFRGKRRTISAFATSPEQGRHHGDRAEEKET